MRILRRAAVSLLSIAVLAYVGTVGFLALRENALVYPGAHRSGLRGAVPRDTLTVSWDTLSVMADDGVRVFLLESRAAGRTDAPWILYFHGNGSLVGDRGSVNRYRLFGDLGFDVLAVEYRGYGDGGNAKPSEEGLYADARAGWRYLTGGLHVQPGRVVLYGWSLGTGVATELATEVHPAGLVTEGTFTSLPAVARDIYPWVPTGLVMRNRFDNLGKVARVRVPWLLLHGRHDGEVPFPEARQLAAAASAHARLVPLDAGHDDGVLGDRATAEAALRAFADSLFGVHAPAAPPEVTPGATSGSTSRSSGPTPAASRR